jgi:hypothetical protein
MNIGHRVTSKVVKIEEKKGLVYIQNQFLKLEFNLSQGSFSIYNLTDNYKVISDASYSVILNDKQDSNYASCQLPITNYQLPITSTHLEDEIGKGGQIRITTKNIYPESTLIINMYEQQPFLILQEIVKNNSPSSIRIKHFLPLRITKDKSSLYLGVSCNEWSFYKQGWQSWSPTYSVKIKERDTRAKLGIVRRVIESYPERREGRQFLSEGMTVIKDTHSGKSMFLGFTTFFNQLCTIKLSRPLQEGWIPSIWAPHFNENRISLECVADAEGYALKPQEELSSEKLMLDFSSSPEALQNYAEVVSREMKAIKREEVPVGWCSWYYYFNRINTEEIEKNLRIIAEKKRRTSFSSFSD